LDRKYKYNNKMSLKIDKEIVLSNSYVLGQIDGVLNRLRGRKRLPCNAVGVWKYNLIHQKDIFSKPLVHGKLVCSIPLIRTVLCILVLKTKRCHSPNLALLQECALTYKIPTRLNSLG
jgi:hypothetical protein